MQFSSLHLSSLHTHSLFCDGSDDIETLCRAACEKGLSAIGFSSHAPITRKTGWVTPWHLKDDRLGEYLDAIHASRRRYAGRLTVFAGLEVDYIKGLVGPADFQDYLVKDTAEDRGGLDYLIASVHYLMPPTGEGEPFTIDGPEAEFETGLRDCFRGDIEALVNAYWDAEESLVSEGGFDILGHVDLIKKNNARGKYFSAASACYLNRIASLAGSIAKSGIVVEINTGGLNRGKTTELYPSPDFLRLLREKDVPVIITADAHRAEHLDGHYQDAVAELRKTGYTETVLFNGRQNSKPVWESEAIT